MWPHGRTHENTPMECGLALVAWLLLCGLTAAVPDRAKPDSPFPDKQLKIEELMTKLTQFRNASATDLARLPLPKPPHLSPPSSDDSVLNEMPEVDGGPSHLDDRPIKSYEDFYRVYYGTQAGVEYLKKKYGPDGLQKARAKFPAINIDMAALRRANDHYLRMRRESRCGRPQPQIVRAHAQEADRSLRPRCVRLHRCGAAAGCCDSDELECAAAEMQQVALYFHVIPVRGASSPRLPRVERVLFENHTRCECRPLNHRPRMADAPARAPRDGAPLGRRGSCGECPVPFSPRLNADGSCTCDCFDRQKPCLRIKRGKDPLPDIERRCVASKHCSAPECEHGAYEPTNGSCPRRHDDDGLRTYPRRSFSQHSRWAYHERD